ncbi:MAG: site-specific integrase [Lachnospiraceae bacterium]|nr:site-specific integrase [Lachnospiraceae bacterium]
MTGMRNGEARALQWKCVDFDKKLIHVEHTLVTLVGGGYMLDTPKTKTSKRIVPLLPQAEEILREMKDYAVSIGIGNEDNFVFCLPDGSAISRERVTVQLNHIEKKMKDNNIPVGHITCHTLRHTFATRAIENGMKPQVLKTILGHSNISITMDLYAHVLGEEKVQEMILLENLF